MEKWHKNVGFVSVASQVKPAMTIAKDWVVFVKPSFIPVTDRIWCVVDLTLSGRWNRVRVTTTEYQIYNSEYHAIIPFRWSFYLVLFAVDEKMYEPSSSTERNGHPLFLFLLFGHEQKQ